MKRKMLWVVSALLMLTMVGNVYAQQTASPTDKQIEEMEKQLQELKRLRREVIEKQIRELQAEADRLTPPAQARGVTTSAGTTPGTATP